MMHHKEEERHEGVAFTIKINMHLVVVLYFLFFLLLDPLKETETYMGQIYQAKTKKTLLNKMNMK